MDAPAQLKTALAARYDIEREIGRGGMASVYLARDLRHGRNVAIKVLNPELGAVLGVERFLSEIRVTAKLQHPSLLPLFDSGEAEGQLFYVMPFVEGESLRARLQREKQLPVAEALRIAGAVASALDYAHRHGVIHRDLKPENILLHEGQPLVADFGIALAVSIAGGSRVTQTGISLGTPQYMSPEQATGDRPIDQRSDVYSLGAVLYEMLAGDPPHTASTAQGVIAKVLTEHPASVRVLRAHVPPHVDAAIGRALEKLPADRWSSAQEFAEALQPPGVAIPLDVYAPASVRAVRRKSWSSRLAHSAPFWAGAFVLAGLVAVWQRMQQRTLAGVDAEVLHLPLEFNDPVRRYFPWGPGIEISPQGNRIAYQSGSQAGTRVGERGWWLLDLRDGSRRRASNDILGNNVSFSPTGDSIAHGTSAWLQQIYIVDLATGRASQITDSAQGRMTWGSDGWIYYPDLHFGLRRVRPSDGRREVLVRPEAGDRWIALSPVLLPGSNGILYTRVPRAPWNPARSEIMALDLQTKQSRVLTRGIDARFLPSGHILVAQPDGSLFGARFDADAMQVQGRMVRLLDGLEVRLLKEAGANFVVADNGTLVYVRAAAMPEDTIVIVGRDGSVRRVMPTLGGTIVDVARSDDGRWAATVHRGLTAPNVMVWQEGERESRRLTFSENLDYYPRFVPRTDDVAFVSPRDGKNWDLYRVDFNGSGAPVVLLDRPGDIRYPRFSADGRWVVFCEADRFGHRDVMAHRFGPDSATVPIVATESQECDPDLSPDLRWIAYHSDESGRNQIYVQRFGRERSGVWQISTAGGTSPRWSADGRELYYISAQRELMAVRIRASETFSFTAPTRLFALGDATIWTREFGPGADEFVLLRVRRQSPGHAVMVRNFDNVVRAALER